MLYQSEQLLLLPLKLVLILEDECLKQPTARLMCVVYFQP